MFDSAKEDVIEVPVDKLSPGDTVIFKSNNSETKDIVTTLLDTYIDEYQTTSEDIQSVMRSGIISPCRMKFSAWVSVPVRSQCMRI